MKASAIATRYNYERYIAGRNFEKIMLYEQMTG